MSDLPATGTARLTSHSVRTSCKEILTGSHSSAAKKHALIPAFPTHLRTEIPSDETPTEIRPHIRAAMAAVPFAVRHRSDTIATRLIEMGGGGAKTTIGISCIRGDVARNSRRCSSRRLLFVAKSDYSRRAE